MKGNIHSIKGSFGFIFNEKENKDIFFGGEDLTNCNIRQLQEGDTVEFDLERNPYGKPVAKNVRKLYQTPQTLQVANPGIHPNVKLDHFNEDEKKLSITFKRFFMSQMAVEQLNSQIVPISIAS